MRPVVWHGVGDVRLDEVPDPTVQDPTDMPRLLDLVRTGAVDPSSLLTQVEELPSVLDAYATFDWRGSGWTKVVLDPAA